MSVPVRPDTEPDRVAEPADAPPAEPDRRQFFRWLGLIALGALATACGAGAPTYAGCADEADCADQGDACYRLIFDRTDGTTADGNLCTHECTTDADCTDGVCLALGGDRVCQMVCMPGFVQRLNLPLHLNQLRQPLEPARVH